MIIGPDFIWLHFPKCAGLSVEGALSGIYSGHEGYYFDLVGPNEQLIWHDSISQRTEREPLFQVVDRRIFCCIRRLPYWILSRIHYEAYRSPGWIATREMILKGQFFEHDGSIVDADIYIDIYNNPPVDVWLRTEHIVEDLARAVNVTEDKISTHLKQQNETNYIKNLDFWFTASEMARLYEACPKWAAVEKRVYGSLL